MEVVWRRSLLGGFGEEMEGGEKLDLAGDPGRQDLPNWDVP